MNTITIHTDPIPPKKVGQIDSVSSEIRIALERLEIGQCFYLPYSKQTYNICSTQTSYRRRMTGKKFTLRQLYKDNEKIVGVWRIA